MDSKLGNTFVDPNPIELSAEPSFSSVIGPFLRFRGILKNNYSVSVLVIARDQPEIQIYPDKNKNTDALTIAPKLIDTFKSYNFYRYMINVELLSYAQTISYRLITLTSSQVYNFRVPAFSQNCRFASYSCAGVSIGESVGDHGGYCSLWKDLLSEHQCNPFHLIIGLGDQLYNDLVFYVPSLAQWMKSKTRKARTSYPCSDLILNEISNFYFQHYCLHFMRDHIRHVFSSVPSINVSDDHDIFNGAGSYPADLQNCPIFKAVFEQALKFYYLFQLHCNINDPDPVFIKNSNFISTIGPNQAILCLDTRSERSLQHILQPSTYKLVFQRIKQLPHSVKHLIIVVGIPILFPSSKMTERVFNTISKINMKSNYMFDQILSNFGEPSVLSDIDDQWGTLEHTNEKHYLIKHCQEISKEFNLRITFLSGDSHCAGSSQIYAKSSKLLQNKNDEKYKRHTKHRISPVYDYKHINQIISSAITNVPPPGWAMVLFHLNPNHVLYEDYYQAMTITFNKDVAKVGVDLDGLICERDKERKPKYKWMIPRRNYSTFTYTEEDELIVEYFVEKEIDYKRIGSIKDVEKFRACQGYKIFIPPLLAISE
eukprot:NODE_276_length_12087_cov_0.626376.p2 type:complete len:598 gc:universal NODE_276_length_12087_cov_0.626376:9765-11558(+)